jgi:cytoskeletal protein CcmA (bactofilin family)
VAPGQIRQLNVTGAAVQGELDLRFAKADCPLRLEQCSFDSPVTLYEARLRSVSLRGSTVPGIDARHVRVTGDLNLDDVHLTGCLRLGGAHLRDDLHLADATIEPPVIRTMDGNDGTVGGDKGNALLDLDNIEIKGKIEAPRLTVHGTVSTKAATVAGPWRMAEAHFLAGAKALSGGTREDAVAWNGEGMRIEGTLDASHLQASGQVRLVDTQVLCLVFRDVQIENSRTALILDRLDCRGSVFCDKKSDLTGGMHAIGIQAGATLYLGSGTAKAPAEGEAEDRKHAVDLRRARITGELKCTEGFHATGACNLAGAHIGGRVSFPGASLQSVDDTEGQVAFTADGAQMDSDLSLEDFSCRGSISLRNTRIGGGLTVTQNEDGGQCALAAEGLSVSRDATLNMTGTVDLNGADITGDLTLRLNRLNRDDSGAAADLSAATADVLTLIGSPPKGFLDLTRASVNLLRDSPQDWPDGSRIILEGFEYRDITTNGNRKNHDSYRLQWLKTGTRWTRGAEGQYEHVGFTPQPYQQLAAYYRNAGNDNQARRVLHKMYSRRNAGLHTWHQPVIKLWNTAQNIFIGYGYAPGFAFAWLVVFALVAAWLFGWVGKVHTGFAREIIMSLGLVLPGTGYGQIDPWKAAGTTSHVIAGLLVLWGLVLGATVIAALARVIKQ